MQTIVKIEDRHRDFVVDGRPVATGVVAVGDAWACTNPSRGRGASIGMLQALALRETLRDVGLDNPYEFAQAFHRATRTEVEPLFEWSRYESRHRLAEIDAAIRGEPYDPGDWRWELEQALCVAAEKDPDCLRLSVRAGLLISPLHDGLGTDGLADRSEVPRRRLAGPAGPCARPGRARGPRQQLSAFRARTGRRCWYNYWSRRTVGDGLFVRSERRRRARK